MTSKHFDSARYRYREVFFAHNGAGPYLCFYCENEVEFGRVTVHHLDHDHYNDESSNLAAAHFGCHRTYHATARIGTKRGPNSKNDYRPTAEHNEKNAVAHTGKKHSNTTKELIRSKATGRALSEEAKVKISLAHRGRTVSEETRQRMSAAAKTRWEKVKSNGNNA